MKKLFCTLFLGLSFSYANMVGGIALTVNDEPITVYDIEEAMAASKKSKSEAVSDLIDEILFNQEVEKNNITADVFDVNNHLEKIASQNGMDLYTFKSIIKQKYKDYDAFEANTKLQVLKEKLAKKVIRGKLKIATDDDLKIYYNNNLSVFQSATTVKVVQLSSKSKKELIAVQKNPKKKSKAVSAKVVKLTQSKLNPQLRFLLNDTKVNQFTPIFVANKQFITLLIQEKEGLTALPFEEVKQRIFNVVMVEREKAFLKEYFEKLKLTANIKIIR